MQIIPCDKFRTGLTFQEVYSMAWSYSEDNRDWPKGKGKTAGRRHTVLGKWHQIKKEMYEQYLLMHQGGTDLVPSCLTEDGSGDSVGFDPLPF